MGFETILPLREGNGPTLFVSIRRPVLPGSLACSRVISSTMVDYWHSVAAPSWTHADRTNLDEVCEAHLATLLEQQPPALITCWGIPLAVRWRRVLRATACPWRTGGISWLAGYLAAETQNWQEKEANGLDPEVLAGLTANARPSWQHSREVLQRSVYHH